MTKKLIGFFALAALLVGSFLGNYYRSRPFALAEDAVVQAKSLIDSAGGDQTKLALASDLLRGELAKNPDHLLAIFLEGRALQQRGLIDAALSAYERYFARKISIDFAAHFNAAELYEIKGDLQGAERLFQRSIAFAPQESVGWERLIRLLVRQGRVQEAREFYEAFSSQFPAHSARSDLEAILPRQ